MILTKALNYQNKRNVLYACYSNNVLFTHSFIHERERERERERETIIGPFELCSSFLIFLHSAKIARYF